MRTLRNASWLLILPLFCLAGCASTTDGVSSKMKTVASVGDKRLPTVTGEPGDSVVANVQPPERPMRSEGRLSGRVVDENGDPLPDVRVRLAVGNSPGGKVISSTTDRTGAFTLRGVRPGSDYTVIAEWEEGNDYLSGRSDVQAPDTDVRITLAPSDAPMQSAGNSIRPNRVQPISEEESLPEGEDESFRPSTRKPPRVNTEDLPPAPEAEAYDPPARTRAPAEPRPQPAGRGVRWRPVGSDGVTRQDPQRATESGLSAAPASAPQDYEAREAGVLAENPLVEDEGPNPLPPALEPGESASGPDDGDTIPPARQRRRSARSRDEVDPLPPAREPGQMSVSAPAERESRKPEKPPEGEPEPRLSEDDPLPPDFEPAQEQGRDSASDSDREPERASPPDSSQDASFLPPAVEADLPALVEATPEPSQERPAATQPDLLSQTEAAPGLPGDLPAPVEAAAAPESPADLPPAVEPAPQKALAQSSPFEPSPPSPFEPSPPSPFEPSPFDSPPSGPTPGAAAAPAVAAAAAADQSIFDTAMASPAADPPAPSQATRPAAADPVDTRKRPTWKDLASLAPKVSNATGEAKKKVLKSPTPSALSGRPVTTQASARAAPPQIPADVGVAYCDYDAKHRKINDFRLPDLEGRPVRFQELDADLVLIDFWGTWCQPCLKSVPHLVDLQKRMGASKFKVVGIACEQGPPAERAKKVAEEVRRLGINYPILMSGMDGPCPLQDALKVQSYPTLILVDRQGRVVWRDQGATPVTLARLDRFLASATSKSDETRRY